ncbi:ABC transporter permease [Paenibacillus sonchi]|uniref:ABC transporter permease n=1 Tax=Paenibacillus sonchi TaxID=373687 RepID=UPI001E54677E|nr:ABC transporter permease [Paenibacillus sonchi]MCE3202446.1 ABC transporter permease [Paenibacillus sonchi]
MVALIRYEWRKHFWKSSLVAAVLLFTTLNIVKIYGVYENNSLLANPGWKSLYVKQYHEFGGAITDGKIRKLMDIYQPLEDQTAELTLSTTYRPPGTRLSNVYEDWNFYRYCYFYPMKYDYDYKAYAMDVVTSAQDNTTFYTSLGNNYESRKNAVVAKLFHGREIASFNYTEMYKYYVQYDFSAFLVLLICLYGLMSVFLSEKETEMDTLLVTTRVGARIIWAKLLTATLFVCGISFWFWLVDFMAFSVVFDSWDASISPLYALEDFIHTPLNVNLGQYTLLSGLLKTAGILVLGCAFLLLSSLFRNALIPFIAGLFISFGCIYQEEAFMGSGRILLKIMNPFVLVINRDLFRKTEFISLFGYPVQSYIAALLIGAAWGIMFLCGISFFIKKNTLLRRDKKHASLDV